MVRFGRYGASKLIIFFCTFFGTFAYSNQNNSLIWDALYKVLYVNGKLR